MKDKKSIQVQVKIKKLANFDLPTVHLKGPFDILFVAESLNKPVFVYQHPHLNQITNYVFSEGIVYCYREEEKNED